MKFPAFACVLALVCSSTSHAEPVTATTSDGRVIIVNSDGTWQADKVQQPNAQPATKVARPAGATSFVKAPSEKFGVWYNPQKWSVRPSADGDQNRLRLHLKSGDGYALLIAEGIEIPPDALQSIALENAKEAAPDAKIVSQSHRLINGKDVLAMQITGTIKGIQFIYDGYYYGGPEGTVQLLTYTGQNLFEKLKPDLEELLNGLDIGAIGNSN